MNRSITSLLAATALVTTAAISACAGHTPRVASVASGPSPLDTVVAQLTECELQRIALHVAPTVDVASTRKIDARIVSLHERLRGLRADDDMERTAAERLLLALDARNSSVASQVQQMRTVYTDQYPTVRQALREQELLKQRRSEIEAALGRK
jgi:DNA-binding SARP family transcriptional activator